MTLLFAPNLSMLWTDLPLADRFEAAARAGFGAVELWWPGDAAAATLPGLTSRWKLWLALLNFDGGDLAAGERGLAADPHRRTELRANVPVALEIARACGCARLNLLIGKRQAEYSRSDQLDCARDNVAWAGAQAARVGCEVLIEALNPWDNGPCLLTTTAAAAAFAASVGLPNIRLQYDVYHMQRTEGDLVTTLDEYWPLIRACLRSEGPEPFADGGDVEGCLVADGELVVAGGDGPVALEAVDAALHGVALLVPLGIEGGRPAS